MRIIKRILMGCAFILACVGLVSIILQIIDWDEYAKDAAHYSKKCNELEIGMSVIQVQNIMGDHFASSRNNYGVLEGHIEDKFLINYPGAGKPGNICIVFDGYTGKANAIYCDEDWELGSDGRWYVKK